MAAEEEEFGVLEPMRLWLENGEIAAAAAAEAATLAATLAAANAAEAAEAAAAEFVPAEVRLVKDLRGLALLKSALLPEFDTSETVPGVSVSVRVEGVDLLQSNWTCCVVKTASLRARSKNNCKSWEKKPPKHPNIQNIQKIK